MSDVDTESDRSSVDGQNRDLSTRVRSRLSNAEGPVSLGELAARVAEDGDEGEAETSRGDVHESLHDRVLPDLDDDGTVEFDVDTGIVRPLRCRRDGLTRLRRGTRHVRGRGALAVPVLFGLGTALYTGSPLPTLGASVSSLGILYLLGLFVT